MNNERILFVDGINSKKKQVLLALSISLIVISIVVLFSFHMMFQLDVEYDNIEYPVYKLIIVIIVLLLIDIPLSIISFSYLKKIKTKVGHTIYRDGEAKILYIYDGKDYKEIEAKNIISLNDNKNINDIFFNIGKRKGLKGAIKDFNQELEIKYLENGKINSITTLVGNMPQAEERISQIVQKNKNPNSRYKILGMKPKRLNIGYLLITLLLIFTFIITGSIICDSLIKDYKTQKSIGNNPQFPTLAIIITSTIVIILSVVLLIIYIDKFKKHRNLPIVLYFMDLDSLDRYFYCDNKYIKVTKNEFVSDISKRSVGNNGQIIKRGLNTYASNESITPYLKFTIKFRKDGKTKEYSFHAKEYYDQEAYLKQASL